MNIEVKKTPRYHGATDEHCIHYLYVNGFLLGEWVGGLGHPWLDPEKWAKKQIKKRLPVVERNIARLSKELAMWEKERELLKQ